MDKRKEANLKVRRAITDALFSLMKESELSRISIAEIIRKASVARVSFYRNYDSKEDVLTGLVRDVLDEFRDTANYPLSEYMSLCHIDRSLQYFDRYRKYVLNLHNSGYSAMLLDELNQFHAMIAGDMMASSDSRYQIYIFIGALYNTAIVWLSEEQPKERNTVARILWEAIAPRKEPSL